MHPRDIWLPMTGQKSPIRGPRAATQKSSENVPVADEETGARTRPLEGPRDVRQKSPSRGPRAASQKSSENVSVSDGKTIAELRSLGGPRDVPFYLPPFCF